jgi:PleD family two-component response regulator
MRCGSHILASGLQRPRPLSEGLEETARQVLVFPLDRGKSCVRAMSDNGAPTRTSEADLPGGAGIRVLVVDDYPDNVESMALLLRLYGYKADVARTGSAALLAAQAHPPDAVLCDVSLPGMSGLEVAKKR